MLRNTLLTASLILGGCSVMSHDTTIGRLGTDDDTPLTDIALPRVSHKDVRDEYRSLLQIVEDRELREQIERRIAGVYMLFSFLYKESAHHQAYQQYIAPHLRKTTASNWCSQFSFCSTISFFPLPLQAYPFGAC